MSTVRRVDIIPLFILAMFQSAAWETSPIVVSYFRRPTLKKKILCQNWNERLLQYVLLHSQMKSVLQMDIHEKEKNESV